MATGIKVNGVDLLGIFSGKGASTAPATGIKSNGTDINQLLLAHADGVDIGYNTGITVNGSDLRNYFAQVSGSTPLPINGKRYNVSAIYASTSSGSCTFQFLATSSAWTTSCSRTASPSAPTGTPTAGTIDTGAEPSGASTIQYTLTWQNASGDTGAGTTSNAASSATAISSNPALSISLAGNGTSATQTTYTVNVVIRNSSGTTISNTTFTVQLLGEGTA